MLSFCYFFPLSHAAALFVCDASFCQWNPGSLQLSLSRSERKGERNRQSGAATLLVRRCSINHAGARLERRKLREGPAESQTARRDAASRLLTHPRPTVKSPYKRGMEWAGAATGGRNTLMCNPTFY